MDKTGCIRLCGNTYETDSKLARQKVAVRYNPFNLSEIQVWQDEKRYADAVPVELNRKRRGQEEVFDLTSRQHIKFPTDETVTRRSSIPGGFTASLCRKLYCEIFCSHCSSCERIGFPISFRFGPSASRCNSLRTMTSADSCGFGRASRFWLRSHFASSAGLPGQERHRSARNQ